MSTNYYARIIPSKSKKDHLIDLINNSNDYNNIIDYFSDIYNDYSVDLNGNKSGGIVHLGKKSGGWKFLWNPNIYFKRENGLDIPVYLYELNRKSIEEFINRDDIELYDEYNELVDKDEFFKTAYNETDNSGKPLYDYNTYINDHPENSTFFIDSSKLVKYLTNAGYKFTNKYCVDFYSDGLRFSSCTDFS